MRSNVPGMIRKSMKLHVFIIILLAVSVKVFGKGQDQGYHIKIQIDHFKDTMAYLGYHFGDQKFVKDTSKVFPNNVLDFKGEEELKPGIYFIYSPSVYFEILVKEQNFEIQTDTMDLINHMKVINSPENLLFNQFQRFMAEKQKLSVDIEQKINELDKVRDSVQIVTLRNQQLEIGKEIEAFQQNIIDKNPGSFVTTLLLAMKKPKVPDPPKEKNGVVTNNNFQFYYYKNHFFDHFNLSDPALLRTPLYQSKIDEYIEKLTYQHPDSISKTADYLLGKAAHNDETFRYMLVKLTNKYETSNIMGMERVFVYLAENYYLNGKAFWADSSLVAKFDKRVKELKPNLVGNTAPDMILRDTLLRPVHLSAIDSRFIVLYFYDPDCGHCKKSTPKLRNSYERLKQKNVEVLAACTVTDIEKWKAYIRDNHLTWINAADPYYQSNFRADYDIKTTPAIYVLNKNKEIIAKRIGVEQIEDFIDRMIEIENNKS